MANHPVNGRAPGVWRRARLAPVLLAMLASAAAHAGLGETAESVARDHAALGGTALAVRPAVAYDVHETTTSDGARVRQYVSRAGIVFAVAWSGRTQPDLKVILAQHYDAYLAAATAHRGSHHVLNVSTPELVISIIRAPRGFEGTAHLPALLPAGTPASELR